METRNRKEGGFQALVKFVQVEWKRALLPEHGLRAFDRVRLRGSNHPGSGHINLRVDKRPYRQTRRRGTHPQGKLRALASEGAVPLLRC